MSVLVRAAVGVGTAALAATAFALAPAAGAQAQPGAPTAQSASSAPAGGARPEAAPAASITATANPSTSGVTATGLVSLNVSPRVQEQSNWCWAATGSAVADYLGASVSQNEFCNRAIGQSSYRRCPNTQGDIDMIQTAFDSLGIDPGYGSGYAVPFSTVQREVQGGRPLLARILWRAGGGHYLLVEGMDPTARTVQWIDPWPSDQRVSVASYNQFRSNSQFTWTHSISQIGATS